MTRILKFATTAAIAICLWGSEAGAQSATSYVIQDVNGQRLAIKTFACPGSLTCPGSVPVDANGLALSAAPGVSAPSAMGVQGVSGGFAVATTITGTLPGFASTPTFNCGTGCSGSGGTASSFAAAFPATGTAIGVKNGANMVNLLADGSSNLLVNCAVGCAGGSFNNNADAVATSASNGQNAAWLYGFNGTTFDRLRVDANKNLLASISQGGNAAAVKAASTGAAQTDPAFVVRNSDLGHVGDAAGCAVGTNTMIGCIFQLDVDIKTGTGGFGSAFPATGIALGFSSGGNLVAPSTGTPLPTAPQAGELHIGEISSNQVKVQVAQTVTAAAYSAGNALGGLMTVANAARVSGSAGAAGTGGILTGLMLNSKSPQSGVQVDVFLFDANPTGSTCTDKTAFVLAAADFDKVVGMLSIPSAPANGAGWFAGGTTGSVGVPTYFPVTYDLASSTSLFACAVVRAAFTPASTSDISFKFNALRN